VGNTWCAQRYELSSALLEFWRFSNYIIENYESLKKALIKRGYTFKSDTDTEVLINLIEEVKKKEGVKLGQAVQIALNQVVGAYAIAVFDKNKPDELVGDGDY